MGELWHGLMGFLAYTMQEISLFGLWLGLGLTLGLLAGLVCAWVCTRWLYPRRSLDALDAGSPPVPRWAFLSLPLLRWSWWLTWWSAIPTCFVAVGLIWGSAEGCYRAVLHQRLTPEVSRRAALILVDALWQSQAPTDWAKVTPEQPIPNSLLFPTLRKACQNPLACQLPTLRGQEKMGWMADFALRRLIGCYLKCNIESRQTYLEKVRQHLCSRPGTQGHSSTLRQVAESGCQIFVEPQLARWCQGWIQGFAGEFLSILVLILLLPRLTYELGVALLRWRFRG